MATNQNPEDQLKILRRSRAGHRSYTKRIASETEELLKSSEDSLAIEDHIVANEKVLQEKLQLLKELDERISQFIEVDEDLEKEIVDAGEFNRYVLRICVAIERWLKRTSVDNCTTVSAGEPSLSLSKSAKLPKLTLEKFGGDPLSFQSFWDSFESAIHNNVNLDSIAKFNYLKGLLYGSAAQAIAGFSLTNENYLSAVKLLKERFGDVQTIINAHMDSLLNMAPIFSGRASELRKMYDTIEIHIRNLKAFDVDSKNYGHVLISIIMNKVPAEFRLAISRKFPAGKWEIDTLLDVFREELIARERCEAIESRFQTIDMNFDQSKPVPSSTLHTQARRSRQKYISCSFCKGSHPSNQCTNFTDVESRKNIIREKKKCFNCLKSNHSVQDCRSNYRCYICKQKHHISLCERKNSSHGEQANTSNSATAASSSVNVVSCQENVLLQTAQAFTSNCQNDKKKILSRVLFDNCSQKSFISTSLKEQLNLAVVRKEALSVKTFGDENARPQMLEIVNLNIQNKNNGMSVCIEAYVVPSICSPIANQTINIAKTKYDSILNQIGLADDNDNKDIHIDILVGANFYWTFHTGRILRLSNTLTAIHTILGWTLNGNIQSDSKNSSATVNVASAHVLKISHEPISLSKFWEIEEAGTTQKQQFDFRTFSEKIKFDGTRYTVPLPWKDDSKGMIPENFQQSQNRVFALLNRLKHQPDMLKSYDDVIRQQEHDGIIEKVHGPIPPPGKVHYLPHHAVIKDEKTTTKLRVVYDASSNTPSLNDCLEKGPCLLPFLVDILIRFSSYKVAISSDIKQAFLNVGVNESDRDFMRFLWFDDPFINEPNLVTYRFTRVVFGMNSSQFLLSAAIIKHLDGYRQADEKFVQQFLRDLYVDDNISGGDTTEDALTFYRKAKSVLLEAGFELRKWRSNDVTVQNTINSSEKSCTDNAECKILGLSWQTTTDQLCLNLEPILQQSQYLEPTKRNILKTIASIFDPTGILSPVTIVFKLFFQKLCITKCDWDSLLASEMTNEWQDLLHVLSSKTLYQWDRYYFANHQLKSLSDITLHGFCDASKKAYSAVIYITAKTSQNNIIGHLVVCKTKVAPMKQLTIPKLELCSCLLLSSLFHSVLQSLQAVVRISNTFCWSDSLDALFWIKNGQRQRNQFVNNRVTKITDSVPAQLWRHCPGKDNPADLPSRGVRKTDNLEQMFKSWMVGPSFIYEEKNVWPVDLSACSSSTCVLSSKVFCSSCNNLHVNSVDNSASVFACSNVSAPCSNSTSDIPSVVVSAPGRNAQGVMYSCSTKVSVVPEPSALAPQAENVSFRYNTNIATNMVDVGAPLKTPSVGNILDVKRFSNYSKLLRVLSYVLRFVNNLTLSPENRKLKRLELTEIERAESILLIWCQSNAQLQMAQLKNTLGIFYDENHLMRCKGRLAESDLTYNQKHPIFIPHSSELVSLIIWQAHLQTKHGGYKDTLTHLRSKYWISQGKRMVRHVIKNCAFCNRLEGKPFRSQEAAQLPSFRVCASYPFQNTGVDYMGPFLVHPIFSTNATEMHKVHIVLYTCAVTRAVHLDLVPDLSASAFLRSLKRFISRRGIPQLFISDNATCFRSEELRLSDELLSYGITWKFIIESSPWWGGFWERLVRSVKRSLSKIIFRSSVSYDELRTIICEIEVNLNSRPISYIYNDECQEILTPSHLMFGRRLLSKNPTNVLDYNEGSDIVKLTKRMIYIKTINDHFWKRFKNEYVTSLREFHSQGESSGRDIKIGEIVTIHDDEKRIKWRLGKVVKLLKGRDNKVRAALLRVVTPSTGINHLRRPIEKLYPLEIRSQDNTDDEPEYANSNLQIETNDTQEAILERDSRIAADNSILIRRLSNQV